eukprot:CAMPEP_0197034306 /NCGR_PEP_ID=MMETSP1384-20130603/12461_1 /TAXON_ID=29189 /ORGANISM="Ammonia sp." /LENGTH=211 /DNA_ID=CAMNT_0042464221 /DNA_START=126 /DNA_END=761 /DNA_ORIENTATION=+
MKGIFGLTFLLPMIGATSSDGGQCQYEITVSNAKDLIKEDVDLNLGFYKKENYNDVYVDITGYGLGGDDKQKTLRTSVIDEAVAPEWNERFSFSDTDEDCGEGYEKWLFKLYDADTIGEWGDYWDADFLGETKFVYADEIAKCDDIYSFELAVTRDDEAAGTLFVEFAKSGCCEEGETKDEEQYDEEVEEEAEQQVVKEKGKTKGGRRLMA